MTVVGTGLAAAPKYSILEHERRFLVDPDAVPTLSGAGVQLIDDLYVEQSRLRLRKMTSADGDPPVFKFCKKYPSQDALSGPIVNMYLSATEYDLLTALPGRWLRKRRHRLFGPASPGHIDVFEGALDGLVIGEIETADLDGLRAMAIPSWAVREITGDPFFAGDNLARLDAAALKARLDRELARSSQMEGSS